MQSGVNYHFGLLALDSGSFRVYYEFDNSGTAYIPSVPSGQARYSGQLSSIGNFYDTSGNGHFTGQNVRITNETGLFAEGWTILMVYEKANTDHGVLFSSYHGNAIKSGFAVGVTNANKLYFETYSADGPVLLESTGAFGSKNAVSVTRVGNGIYFNLFNFNTKKVESESFFIDSDYLLDSTGWYLGGAPDAPSYFSGSNFNGWMDTFMYFNVPMLPYQLNRFFSGLYATKTYQDTGYSKTFGMNGVTFIEHVDGDDFAETYLFADSYTKTNGNQLGKFDSARKEFISYTLSPQALYNGYLNGTAQTASGYSVSGDLYNNQLVLSGDYFISGQRIVSSGVYQFDDAFIYDLISGVRNYALVPQRYTMNSGYAAISDFSAAGAHVFLNGQKLRSGIDYSLDGPGIRVTNFTGVRGVLSSFPIDADIALHASGAFNYQQTGARFVKGSSMVWLNGVRQLLGVNYVETAGVDLLAGSGAFPIQQSLVLNNSDDFWEVTPDSDPNAMETEDGFIVFTEDDDELVFD